MVRNDVKYDNGDKEKVLEDAVNSILAIRETVSSTGISRNTIRKSTITDKQL